MSPFTGIPLPKRTVYWHETVPPRSASDTSLLSPRDPKSDVVVVGGGFTGLWTAYHIRRRDPSLGIVVLDQHMIGRGPSGRNAGFVVPQVGMTNRQLCRAFGVEAARAAQQAGRDAVRDLVATINAEGIDCDLDAGGSLLIATNTTAERRVRREAELAHTLGASKTRIVETGELRDRMSFSAFRIAMEDPDAATINPTKLVFGLADRCERLGITIREGVQCHGLRRSGEHTTVLTSRGDLIAPRVVFATGPWTANRRTFRRHVVPMYTHIVATAPLSADIWAQLGWDGREALDDERGYEHYFRRTRDGRILWGGGDALQPFAGSLRDRYERAPEALRGLRRSFDRVLPELAGTQFSHFWGGPVDVTADFIPTFGKLDDTNMYFAHGFGGHGVALSYLAGTTMADLVLGRPQTTAPPILCQRIERKFPIEPFRYLGGRLGRREIHSLDRKADGGDMTREPWIPRLVQTVFGSR